MFGLTTSLIRYSSILPSFVITSPKEIRSQVADPLPVSHVVP